ncbi:hypothetical protein [Achromobacter spanius]|uniref:Uncharacterized protein n=1 Tax=Achromobacter spanius TaxID=217203 RepID=A0A2S0IDR4_9BURK|nr:hypothetical protein [Achromobacter spanius]AVJ30171.1 hypothetical protein CLM73_25430 [Achromobacter spanius]
MKAFLLVFEPEVGTQQEVKAVVEQSKKVKTWRYDMPNSFYLISTSSAKELAEDLRTSLPNGRFIVTGIDEYWGWNNSDTWYLLKHKKLKPKAETPKTL